MNLASHINKCIGCRICELVCSFSKNKIFQPSRARIKVLSNHLGIGNFPIICKQCDDIIICSKACPQNAIKKDANTGAVIINYDACTGCGFCIKACPIKGAISIDPVTKAPIKCDLCDGDPKCIKYCPTGALEFIKPEN